MIMFRNISLLLLSFSTLPKQVLPLNGGYYLTYHNNNNNNNNNNESVTTSNRESFWTLAKTPCSEQESLKMDDENSLKAKILRSLIQGEEGENWANERKSGWRDEATEAVCKWDGIGCDHDGKEILFIHLPQTDLLATIPTELAMLTSLSSIDLQENMIQGTIPSEITSMKNLTKLILKKNKLEGKLPQIESKLLEQFDLSHNKLEGEIPHDFCENCDMLKFLELRNNQFKGFLPFGLEDLSKLETISISYNNLSGTLPEYLSTMDNLRFLYLNHNRLVGTIPNDLGKMNFPSYTKNNSLSEVWFQDNLLSGTIPSSLAESTDLVDLYLDGNKLTGSVPEALCNHGINSVFAFALVMNKDQLINEKCDSIICRVGTVSADGVHPCLPCETKIENPYLGQKGECIDFTETEIVTMFLGREDTDAVESACEYDIVVCNEEMQVIEINASGLGLNGSVPDELGYLSMLSKLDISDNELTGYFPSGLRFASLTSINITGNKLKGVIPPLVCENAQNRSINGNNNGDCNSIACPMRTFSKDGTGFGECIPCAEGGYYLGSTSCLPLTDNMKNNRDIESRAKLYHMIFSIILWAIVLAALGKAFITIILYGKKKKKRDNELSSARWLQNHLSRNYHYLISLRETEAVKDPPGVNTSNGANGDVDDYGWQERESILKHRDLENAVQEQKRNPKTVVWEYPDPLETSEAYTDKLDDGKLEEIDIPDDGEDDLINFIRQSGDSDEQPEVWLDVPRIY